MGWNHQMELMLSLGAIMDPQLIAHIFFFCLSLWNCSSQAGNRLWAVRAKVKAKFIGFLALSHCVVLLIPILYLLFSCLHIKNLIIYVMSSTMAIDCLPSSSATLQVTEKTVNEHYISSPFIPPIARCSLFLFIISSLVFLSTLYKFEIIFCWYWAVFCCC